MHEGMRGEGEEGRDDGSLQYVVRMDWYLMESLEKMVEPASWDENSWMFGTGYLSFLVCEMRAR